MIKSTDLFAKLPAIRTAVKTELDDFDLRGDCGNFAVALGNVLGSTEYVCSYENYGFSMEGEPAHCGVRWKGRIWDAAGTITKADLKRWAFNEAYPEDSSQRVVASLTDTRGFREIYDAKRSATIERAIRSVLVQ